MERLKEQRNVEKLLPLLDDPDVRLASAAAETLGDWGERRAVEPLYKRLHALGWGPFDRFESVLWDFLATALAWLEGAHSPWADELLAILRAEDREVGWRAGFLLAKMGDRRAVDPIVERLAAAAPPNDTHDDSLAWKWELFVEALGEFRAVEAVDTLTAALPLAEWWAQEQIALALMDIGDPRAVPALASVLKGDMAFTARPRM